MSFSCTVCLWRHFHAASQFFWRLNNKPHSHVFFCTHKKHQFTYIHPHFLFSYTQPRTNTHSLILTKTHANKLTHKSTDIGLCLPSHIHTRTISNQEPCRLMKQVSLRVFVASCIGMTIRRVPRLEEGFFAIGHIPFLWLGVIFSPWKTLSPSRVSVVGCGCCGITRSQLLLVNRHAL